MPMIKTSTLFFLFDNRDPVNGFAIGTDENFNEMFDEFADVLDFLEKQKFTPETNSVRKILDYAKTH
ncbi:MAG: hypothetical protein K9H64_17775 [Bacteroidales bacterium]|nr:hypothetical protein [Bacteroidales bacterium]MCF8457870.1 hypothetical protein [Bacteroidales bacterium]